MGYCENRYLSAGVQWNISKNSKEENTPLVIKEVIYDDRRETHPPGSNNP
jgi:hypothetical protein